MKSRMAATTASGPSERGVGRRSLSSTAPVSLTRPPFMDVPPTSSATTNELISDTKGDDSAAHHLSVNPSGASEHPVESSFDLGGQSRRRARTHEEIVG